MSKLFQGETLTVVFFYPLDLKRRVDHHYSTLGSKKLPRQNVHQRILSKFILGLRRLYSRVKSLKFFVFVVVVVSSIVWLLVVREFDLNFLLC